MTPALLAVIVCHTWWFNNYLGKAWSLVDWTILSAAIASGLWGFLLAGAHHTVEVLNDRLIVARCWYWKSKQLAAVHKMECRMVIAPCRLSTHTKYGIMRWPGYWIELVLPGSVERLVLACYGSEEEIRAAADELQRATAIQVVHDIEVRHYWQYYPFFPRPRLARVLISQFVFG